MIKLGTPIAETGILPPKSYEPTPDLKPTLTRYARLFDIGKIGEQIGFPFFLKPYDGGGWRAVTRVTDSKSAWKAYEESDKAIMHAQASVEGFDLFVRCIGFGPQTRCVLYDPSAPLHDRYTMKTNFMPAADVEHLRKVTLTINAFFGWDFNSCESLRQRSTWVPIDFANPCPDSQVTSLHFHFPWLVKAYLRWTIFCAATKRRMRKNLDWEPFYEVAASDAPYSEKLDKYVKSRWFSQRLESEITMVRWGHFGQPVLVFPTAGGDAEEIERFQLITALQPLLEAGRIKIYSVDSIAGAAWFNKQGTPQHR